MSLWLAFFREQGSEDGGGSLCNPSEGIPSSAITSECLLSQGLWVWRRGFISLLGLQGIWIAGHCLTSCLLSGDIKHLHFSAGDDVTRAPGPTTLLDTFTIQGNAKLLGAGKDREVWLSFWLFAFLFYVYECCACMYVCVPHACRVFTEGGTESPETSVIDKYEPHGYQDSNPAPPWDWLSALSHWASLQPQKHYFSICL